jgi:hypothetical protein
MNGEIAAFSGIQKSAKEFIVKNKMLIGTGVVLVGAFLAIADRPEPRITVDRQRNSIFFDAQRSIIDSYRAVSRAQDYNHGELGDHASRAKDLLSEANDEIRMAAEYANEHRRR